MCMVWHYRPGSGLSFNRSLIRGRPIFIVVCESTAHGSLPDDPNEKLRKRLSCHLILNCIFLPFPAMPPGLRNPPPGELWSGLFALFTRLSGGEVWKENVYLPAQKYFPEFIDAMPALTNTNAERRGKSCHAARYVTAFPGDHCGSRRNRPETSRNERFTPIKAFSVFMI